MYTHGWLKLSKDRLAVVESFIRLKIQLDALATIIHVDIEELFERQITFRSWWMRHYRDFIGGGIGGGMFPHYDVALQHHDIRFKKESRLFVSTCVCVRVRVWGSSLVETTDWAGGFQVCAYTCGEYRSRLKRLEDCPIHTSASVNARTTENFSFAKTKSTAIDSR